ncbi:MAG: Maf family protein [Patescibacteria group bacterium]
MKIILGSASKSRQSVLDKLGLTYEVKPADIDEKAIRDNDPIKLTMTLAKAKADALVSKIKCDEPTILITADQVVIYKGELREKPVDEAEAKRFLQSYGDESTIHINGVAVTNLISGEQAVGSAVAKVYWRSVDIEVINSYVESGKCFNHAGGFDLNEPTLRPFYIKVEGGEDSARGLPWELVKDLAKQVGIEL